MKRIYRDGNSVIEIIDYDDRMWVLLTRKDNIDMIVWAIDFDKIDHYIAAIRCNCGKRTLYDFGIRRCEDLGKVELDPDTFWKLVKIARSIRTHTEFNSLLEKLTKVVEE